MSDQSIHDLLGEDVLFVRPSHAFAYVPPTQIGDGLAGPENDQQLQIFRDTRPIATDELESWPWHAGNVARHRAGRSFPLNYDWGPAGIDQALPGLELGHGRIPSDFGPGQDPDWHDGVGATEVIPGPKTIYYTATPDVGYVPPTP